MEWILLSLSLSGLVIATLIYVFGGSRNSGRTLGAADGVLALTAVLQAAALGYLVFGAGWLPLTDVSGILLVMAWLLVVGHLVLAGAMKVSQAGRMLVPTALVVYTLALLLLPEHAPPPPQGDRAWFFVHTVTSTVGLAALVLALVMSVLYLIQDRGLKRKRSWKALERFPSLEACDRVALQSVAVGFALLTLAIVTGVVLNIYEHASWFEVRAKEAFPLLAWGVLAALLVLRLGVGYQGRKSAYLTILGSLLLLATLFTLRGG